VTERTEVRVVCPHDTIATFVASSVPGRWIISMQHAKRATYPDGAERWHTMVECRKCGITAPAVNPASYGPVLDWIVKKDRTVEKDRLGITWVLATVVEVPLKVIARAFGVSRQLPD
jgi:hypothetical protein